MTNAPSGHTLLAAIRFHQEHMPDGIRVFVPPPGAWENWGDAVVVAKDGTARTADDACMQGGSLDRTIPYGEPGCLVVSYMYRDASNYKYRGTTTIQGPVDRIGLGLLLGALTCGDDDCFIPQQIGMPGLQPDGSLSDDDHVWHELTAIGWRETVAEWDTTWEDIRPLAEARVLVGYDVEAAMMEFACDDD